jgi:hypothetical protein
MRPLKCGHGHLWLDPPKLIETRSSDKAVLLCLEVQDGHGHLAHLLADLGCQHIPQPRSQNLWFDGRDGSSHRPEQRRRGIRSNEPQLGSKIWQRNLEHDRHEQPPKEAPVKGDRRESRSERSP